jgi:hypothetical protein
LPCALDDCELVASFELLLLLFDAWFCPWLELLLDVP